MLKQASSNTKMWRLNFDRSFDFAHKKNIKHVLKIKASKALREDTTSSCQKHSAVTKAPRRAIQPFRSNSARWHANTPNNMKN